LWGNLECSDICTRSKSHLSDTFEYQPIGYPTRQPYYYRIFSNAFSLFFAVIHFFSSVCGGQLSGHHGRLALSPIPEPSDCEWTIDCVPGSHAIVHIINLALPISEFCTDSFVEFRERNASGPLIGRYCGIVPSNVESQGTLWIRLRHKKEGDDVEGGNAKTKTEQEEEEEDDEMPSLAIGTVNKVPSIELKYQKGSLYGLIPNYLKIF
jgi:hypothetical protein